MELLERSIKQKGKVLSGNVLKVGSFLNNQIDVGLMVEMGKDIHAHFSNCGVNKILTIEASGIGLACITAQFFDCNVVFAKKSKTANVDGETYSAECYSFTHKITNNLLVPKEFLGKGDRVLIVDDCLSNGNMLHALVELCEQAGAELVGAGIVIEKAYRDGGSQIRSRGIRVESLARIMSVSVESGVKFC